MQALQKLGAGFFAASTDLGQLALQMQHAFAKTGVFLLEIEVVLDDDSQQVAVGLLAAEDGLLVVHDRLESIGDDAERGSNNPGWLVQYDRLGCVVFVGVGPAPSASAAGGSLSREVI